jgi:hypothetical protein
MQHIHIYRLRMKHRDLERELRMELGRIRPDDVRIAELKRRKLVLKDEILRLERKNPLSV